MTENELRDRFAEIAFAEIAKISVPMLLGQGKGQDELREIFRISGVTAYKFADAAINARFDVVDGKLTK